MTLAFHEGQEDLSGEPIFDPNILALRGLSMHITEDVACSDSSLPQILRGSLSNGKSKHTHIQH